MLNASLLDHRPRSSLAALPSGCAAPAESPARDGGHCGTISHYGANLGFAASGAWPRVNLSGIPGQPADSAAYVWDSGASCLPRHAAVAGLGQVNRGGPAGGLNSTDIPAGFPAQTRRVAAVHGFPSSREIALPPLGSRGHAWGTPPGRMMIRRGFSGADALLKRAFDLVAAALLLVLVLPLLVAVVAALQVDSPGPVLFVQRRVGRGGQPFGCMKLRTMRVDAEQQLAALLADCPRARREWEADRKLRNDPRVSRLGRLVRKLSLDELPQLVNVLTGRMSMVGPRPIVDAEIARYGAFFPDYCAVKPGLTGLWQISGRNDVSYGDRVQFDRHYARHATFLGDLAIALRTVPAVLFASGSY